MMGAIGLPSNWFAKIELMDYVGYNIPPASRKHFEHMKFVAADPKNMWHFAHGSVAAVLVVEEAVVDESS